MSHDPPPRFLAAVLFAASVGFAQTQPTPTRFALTVYSSADPATFDPKGQDNGNFEDRQNLPGYGVVREIRPIDVAAGVNTLRFTDVAAGIDPTTVSFESLTDPAGTAVLEQNYEYDLVNSAKLLQKYVDKDVLIDRTTADKKSETLSGKLLSADPNGELVLMTDDKQVQIIKDYTTVRVADAAGLITKPTLVWQITAAKAGKHDALVTYQTNGLTWRADYAITLNEGQHRRRRRRVG